MSQNSPGNTNIKAAAVWKGYVDNAKGTTGANMLIDTSLLPSPTEKIKTPANTFSFMTPEGTKSFEVLATTYQEISKVKPDRKLVGHLQKLTGGKHLKQFDSK